MVTIIKNQILKHLSRFTKNLSPEQINVSALRGQGSLSSLQLDEGVLTELLELPPWIRLASATCGRATFHVHWTKLKNMPIELNLEDVQIIVETCSELRGGLDSSNPVTSPSIPPTRYSFIQKVIDGISIKVDTVRIQFTTPVFVATVQMSRILVESKTPQWQRGDLRLTRLKHPLMDQILIFKEISWQSARIEARAVREDGGLPPLRLLTNQAQCRITIKKRLSDCFVVGSRLVLILEEALWVLTDRQLGAALAFADSLATLERNASSQVTRDKAQRKLETLPEYLAQVSQSQGRTASGPTSKSRTDDSLTRIFAHHDVTETSYHFVSQKIDLHLCDDPGLGRSSHPSLATGAALQVTLQKIQFDYYPYHLASADRNRWPGYRESSAPHSQWLRQALTSFRGSLLTLLDTKTHKTSVSDDNGGFTESASNMTPPKSPPPTNTTSVGVGSSPARTHILNQLTKLMTSCLILRLEDFTLYKVTTGERRDTPKSFISGDRERFTLPDEVRALHVEFVNFYYPGDIQFPVPSPKLYVQVNPIKITFDLPSCLWCNSFVLNLLSCIKATQAANLEGDTDLAYVDINVEAIMPRVIVDGGKEHPGQKDRPRSLQAQVSRASITNSHGAAGSVGELAACLASFAASPLLQEHCCTDIMLEHASAEDRSSNCSGKEAHRTRALWGNPRKIWCVKLEPVWAEFCGARASPYKPTPFLDAVPFTLWVYLNMDEEVPKTNCQMINNHKKLSSQNRFSRNMSNNDFKEPKSQLERELKINGEADMQIIAHCSQLVSIQLNHYQYLLVLRLAERLTELAAFLALDSARVSGPSVAAKSMVVGCIVPQVEITLVLPSCCPGKESSRDLDSVLPDSSSLLDLQQNTGSGTLCNQPQGNGSNILSQSSIEKHVTLTSSQMSVTYGNLMGQVKEERTSQNVTDASTPIVQCTSQGPDWTQSDRIESHDMSNKEGTSKMIFGEKDIGAFLQRGFTSLKNKMQLEGALKPNDQIPNTSYGTSPSPGNAPSIADQWDSLSIASSDSERYVMVKLAGDQDTDAGLKLWDDSHDRNADNIEVAAEVVERSSSPSERSLASSCRRRDLVSMSTFRMKHVELLQISRGFYSRVLVNVSDINAEECSSIPWDELQNKFSTRSRGWSDHNFEDKSDEDLRTKIHASLDHYLHTPIYIPYEIDDKVTLESVMGSFSGHLKASLRNLNLTLNMSTALGLSDLIEDEVIIPLMPLEVLLEDISLRLNEDRPASSISSPGAVPLQLRVGGINLQRNSDGIIHITPTASVMKPSASELSKSDFKIDTNAVIRQNTDLMQENDMLRRRLNALERLALENDSLRRSKEEIDILKALLLSAQDQVASLLDEKSTLLDTVRVLQEQASGVEVRGAGSVWSRHNKR